MDRTVDIIFMLDTSGSMAGEIEAVKSECVAFANKISREERGTQVRLGLVGFDIGLRLFKRPGDTARRGPYVVHELSRYTIGVWDLANPEAFKKNVAMLSLGMFGGLGCYLANADTVDIFPHVVSAFTGSSENTRLLVIISDEIGDTSGLDAIVTQLKKAAITTYVVGVPRGGTGAHEAIAERTEGTFWDIQAHKGKFSRLLGDVATAIARRLARKRYGFTGTPFTGDTRLAHTTAWSSTRPGCLIFLLDQSQSMQYPFAGGKAGAGKRKCDMVATIINGFLSDLVKSNTASGVVRPRAEIAALGYEGEEASSALSAELSRTPLVGLAQLRDNPLRIETRSREEVDEDGNTHKVSVTFPIWVEPRVGARTPMCAALQRACEIADEWATRNPDRYPPVVINVTDGASTDGDPTYLGRELVKINTRHGNALLFNCHITHLAAPAITFPSKRASLPTDPEGLAPLLFDLSSPLPASSIVRFREATGQAIEDGARGFIFNGDALAVREMFTFATMPASAGFDRNL